MPATGESSLGGGMRHHHGMACGIMGGDEEMLRGIIEWSIRMNYDARYNSSDDPIHRLLELLHLSFLATAVVHIRTVDVSHVPSQRISRHVRVLSGGDRPC